RSIQPDIENAVTPAAPSLSHSRRVNMGALLLVPTLRVGTHGPTLCVALARFNTSRDAERPTVRSHGERGNESGGQWLRMNSLLLTSVQKTSASASFSFFSRSCGDFCTASSTNAVMRASSFGLGIRDRLARYRVSMRCCSVEGKSMTP